MKASMVSRQRFAWLANDVFQLGLEVESLGRRADSLSETSTLKNGSNEYEELTLIYFFPDELGPC